MPRQIGLVFDLDDTLYLERDYARSGFRALADWLSIPAFSDAAWEAFTRGDTSRVFDVALPAVGLDPSAARIAELIELYRAHAPTIRLAPDAERLLSRWHVDWPLALLTDGFLHSQINKVRALGLDSGRIDPIIFTDAWGREYWKPHLRAFESIASSLRLPASALVYVADNAAKDFVAPNALGWRTVQVARPGAVHGKNGAAPGGEPDAVIASLDELEYALGLRKQRNSLR